MSQNGSRTPDQARMSEMIARMDAFGRKTAKGESAEVTEMRRNRAVMRRTASGTSSAAPMGASINFATGRPRDPLFYWKQNNLPYDLYDHNELKRVRAYCRLLYQSHPMIGSCVDIYTKYPLLGMELTSKDDKLVDFYTDLFLNEDGEGLNYKEFFIDFGREYWTVGESVPFGSFNESLGIWDDEELLNPDDLEVQQSPFLKEPRYFIHLPETIRNVITQRTPAWEYQKLMEAYPELSHYTAEDALMPVSNILLRHYRFKADTFNKRGVPLLMRAMRPIMQEEMLNAAMDAIADRLYTPLLLVRLGASATDIGTNTPWIPTQGDLEDFEEALDGALAADFRALIYHFGVQMESVFGRENMPDLNSDFERIEDRVLQTFGLSKTMLTGGSSGETYAADALNRDLISQLLTTYQSLCVSHYNQRAKVVAEAQEHYDYEERNGKRYVKMEEILEIDEESGEERIVEQPKLLYPTMKMRCTTPETPVLTPSGYVRADSLRPGDSVIAWDEDSDALVISEIEASRSNGIKPVIEVKTQNGRSVVATRNHPFLTDRGWVCADDLMIGDRVRVATRFTPSTPQTLSEDEARFIGLMIGDGGCTGTGPRFTAADPETKQWMVNWLSRWGLTLKPCVESDIDYNISAFDGKHTNRAKELLEQVGLWGHSSGSKRIPADVWTSGPFVWKAFLSGYFDTDGTLTPDKLVAWDSRNRELLRDVQTMLALMGIGSALITTTRVEVPISFRMHGRGPSEAVESISYRVAVQNKRGLRDLGMWLTPLIARKQKIWSKPLDYDARRKVDHTFAQEIKEMKKIQSWTYDQLAEHYGLSRSLLHRAVQGEFDDPALFAYNPDWVKVTTLTEKEPTETWALTVAHQHTHVTDGLVTHNTLNLKDEEAERQFYESLREAGVPISMKTRLINVPIEFDDEIESSKDEAVQLAVAEQETRREIFLALRNAGLPIPEDLKQDFMPKAAQAQIPEASVGMRVPMLGVDPLVDTPNLAPTAEDFSGDQTGGGTMMPGQPTMAVDPFDPSLMSPQDGMPMGGDDQAQRPPESDEQRSDMPKAASTSDLYRAASRMRQIIKEHYQPPTELGEVTVRKVSKKVTDAEGKETTEERDEVVAPTDGIPRGRYADPKHIGLRRHAGVTRNTLWGSLEEDPDADPDED